MERYRASAKGKEDIHTKLMKGYKDIPSWWFYVLLGVTFLVSLMVCIFLHDQIQMPWWGLAFASALAFIFTLPISIITATTNQVKILKLLLPNSAKKKSLKLFYPQKWWIYVKCNLLPNVFCTFTAFISMAKLEISLLLLTSQTRYRC